MYSTTQGPHYQLVCSLDTAKTTCLAGGTVTKLLVTGLVGLQDLWMIFSTFGEISNISMEGGGEAKVTFTDGKSLESFQESGEIHVGNFKLLVTKIQESPPLQRQQPGWTYERSFLTPPPPVYGEVMYQTGYPQYPQYPLPPPSPHYDAAILDMGHPELPEQVYPQYSDYHYQALPPPPSDLVQPLTPITPCPSPQPAAPQYFSSGSSSFFLPPSPTPSSTLASLSGTSFISQESNADDQLLDLQPPPRPPAQVRKVELFKSPFKRFNKFTGVPVHHGFPLRPQTERASWYQAGDRWGHRRSRSSCEVTCQDSDSSPWLLQADGGHACEKVVGSRKGIPATKVSGKSHLTGEPDILRGLASLALE